MANSYENTIMPEKPEEQLKPDAIPVDDKGQPLPDPTESLSDYIEPKGVEALKKAYSEVEVDETVRETMEPPQRTSFLRKHKPGKRGYDYYGTPAGSVPNDSNGVKPSPLSELFSEAEALEPDFNIDKIKEHVLNSNEELGVVETPKLDRNGKISGNPFEDESKKDKDDFLKREEVVKDPNAPKFLDAYKESTNTRVIYQSDAQGDAGVSQTRQTEDAGQIFAEHSHVTKAKKKISKREEKKAIRAAIRAEKKKAKERRKAEKAARKAAKKRGGKPADTSVTSPDEIMKLQTEKLSTEKAVQPANPEKEPHKAEVKPAAEKTDKEKDEAQKQIDEANRRREEAQKEAILAAQEAERLLKEEKEALAEQEKEKQEAIRLLNEEKAAVKKAVEEAKAAREEAEKLRAELESMKTAAAQALRQKQEAEEAAKLIKEEKEKTEKETRKTESKSKAEKQKNDSTKEKEKPAGKSSDEASEKPKAEKETSKAKNEKETQPSKGRQSAGKKMQDVYSNTPTMEIIKRRIAEMEAQLSPKDAVPENETAADPSMVINKDAIVSRSKEKKG